MRFYQLFFGFQKGVRKIYWIFTPNPFLIRLLPFSDVILNDILIAYNNSHGRQAKKQPSLPALLIFHRDESGKGTHPGYKH
jgi:hypothetical protein